MISTFGSMFAPEPERAAAELVRVCATGGRVLMTTWLGGGFAGELFELTASFLPASAGAGEPPSRWGSREHVEEVFGVAGARPSLARETAWLCFRSIDDAVRCYARDFGPFVLARAALEPQGRWDAFLAAFEDLACRFAPTPRGTVHRGGVFRDHRRELIAPAVERDVFSIATVENQQSNTANQGDTDGTAAG